MAKVEAVRSVGNRPDRGRKPTGPRSETDRTEVGNRPDRGRKPTFGHIGHSQVTCGAAGNVRWSVSDLRTLDDKDNRRKTSDRDSDNAGG
jgi:hypothetical protein